jgi:hypothetical protein
MFNHLRYSRPCLAFGKGEANKNPGFIVSDTAIKARKFLMSIGKGEKILNSAYDSDEEYDSDAQESESDDLSPGESQVTDLPMSDFSGGPEEDDAEESQRSAYLLSDETDYGPVIDAEDIEQLMEPYEGDYRANLALQSSVVLGSSPPAVEDVPIMTSDADFDPDDASVQGLGQVRSSTKVRAATLGYLWGFSRDPSRLCEEARRLRDDPTQQVLHLCGCGMPFTRNGVLVPGCCEWSHLKLGTAEENGRHKSYHTVMGMSETADYPALCDIVHRGQDGEGLF